MKPLLPRDMVEATRLTRAGRLSDAVALIQSMLRGSRRYAGGERRRGCHRASRIQCST